MKPPRFSRIFLLIAGLLITSQVSAQSVESIFELISNSDLKKAQKALNSAKKNTNNSDRNGELLFASALIADKSGETKKAIGLYLALIDSHPAMLGPYNNLAIHYANEGDYKSAVATLEKALSANQAVATAYGNLQSIYARMASLAYRKALNSNAPTPPMQLATIENSDSIGAFSRRPALVASAESFIEQTLNAGENAQAADNTPPQNNQSDTDVVATSSPQNDKNNIVVAANSVVQKTQSDSVTEPLIESTTEVQQSATAGKEDDTNDEPAVTVVEKPVEVAKVNTAPTKLSDEAKQLAEKNAAEKQALINHVKSWASAWSDRDVDRYLSHYSAGFTPRNNLSIEEWKKQRYGRLRWREFIIVKPSRYRIELNDNVATVNFNQYYKSERFEDTIRKTLKLKKENGQWRITHELI
ncbi:MAG: hypothetical protein KTR18_07465 [Acidiferrobacterales bacterium]|nr:hypothetical protein [Acidiferrobacterales bacterium]